MNDNFERLDLIRRLSEIRSHYNCFNEKERKVYHTLSEAIEALQEPKTGKWIPVDVGDCCYRCSECGFIRDAYLLDVGCYCPQCGLSMTGEQQ